jgi:hypothetical protein
MRAASSRRADMVARGSWIEEQKISERRKKNKGTELIFSKSKQKARARPYGLYIEY